MEEYYINLGNPKNLTNAIFWCFDNIKSCWWTRHPEHHNEVDWATGEQWVKFYKTSKENICSDRIFKFVNSQDALLFKLKWG